jgi:type I restriction enzyme S subunit
LTIVAKLENATAKLKQIKQLRAESLKETEILKSGFIDKILKDLKTNGGSVLISKSKLQINPESINPINEFKNNEFVYIDIASVEQETSSILEYKKILGINAPSRARRLMRANDVVFSSVRPNLKKCFVVDSKLDNQICSTGFIVFRFDENYCNPTFLKLQFLSNWFINQCMDSVTGGHYPALNDNNLQKLELVLPPVEIQNQIVNEIENFNKKLDTIKQLQQQTEAEITAMEKSILNKYIQTN